MLLLYEDFSLKEDIITIVEELKKIDNDSKINEGAIKALLGKGSNLLGLISKKSAWLQDVLDDPKKLLTRKGVMSESDFEDFAKAYAEIYDDLDADFIKKHKKSFGIINDVIQSYAAKQRLEIEIATRAEKLKNRQEEERLAGKEAESIVNSARARTKAQEDRINKINKRRK